MARQPAIKTRDPSVIVDVLHEDGNLYFVIENITEKPVTTVRTSFDKTIVGWEGTCKVSDLRIFKKLDFLAPRKSVRVFIDRAGQYFAKRQPQLLYIKVDYRDHENVRHAASIRHDLSIYRDITYHREPRP